MRTIFLCFFALLYLTTVNKLFCQQNANDSAFIRYLLTNKVFTEEEVQFLSDKKQLKNIKAEICYDTMISFYDSSQYGKIFLFISRQNFNALGNKEIDRTYEFFIKINGFRPYGLWRGSCRRESLPETELSSFILKINGKEIGLPDSIFDRLYNFQFCSFDIWTTRLVELYFDPVKDLVYVYLTGGYPFWGSNYLVKLIFNKNTFLRALFIDNCDISDMEFIDNYNY